MFYIYNQNGKLIQDTLYKNGIPISGFIYNEYGGKTPITKWD